MPARIHTTSSHTIEIDGHTLPIPFTDDSGTLEETARLIIGPTSTTAALVALVHDEDPTDPMEDNNGEFYQFNPRYMYHASRPDDDQWKRIIRANPGRVFTHDGTDNCHGPGTVHCRVTHGPLTVRDTRNDRDGQNPAAYALDDAGGYYIVPEDATDPAAYAAAALQEYSDYCNGSAYGCVVWQYGREDENSEWYLMDRDNECWGYIGYTYANTVLDEETNAARALLYAKAKGGAGQ